MGRVTKTTTRLVNNTDKVIHFNMESAEKNYFFKKTLKPKEWFTEEFGSNTTHRKMRMFEGIDNRLLDISITTNDMLNLQEIAVTLRDGRFLLHFTARSGGTLSRAPGEAKVTWTQSFMNKLYWLRDRHIQCPSSTTICLPS